MSFSRRLEKNPDRRYQSALEIRSELVDLEREINSGSRLGRATD